MHPSCVSLTAQINGMLLPSYNNIFFDCAELQNYIMGRNVYYVLMFIHFLKTSTIFFNDRVKTITV